MKPAVQFFIILGITIFTTLGDSALKTAGSGNKFLNWKPLVFGLVVYVITGLLWFLVYKNIKFSVAGSLYGVCTALVFALTGVFFFKESINFVEIIGIVLAISSILLLGRFN